MKYILLVHHNEQVLGALGETELQQMREESVQLANQINSNGKYLDAAPLQPASTATCVRVREGKRLVTDGPFAETREQLGGYFLINATNLDEAIGIAGQIPGAYWRGRDPPGDGAGGLTGKVVPKIQRIIPDQEENDMQKITPFLWFDDKAEEAMNFYVSIFKNSKVLSVTRYGEAGPGANGTVMTAAFQLDGQEFTALNGGPHFKFTEAISLVVNCETQEEVDGFWEKLSQGGEKSRCGWLKDKYGLSWQIVPTVLVELYQDKDAEKTKRVMAAMLQMDKLDIKALKQAYEGQ